MEFFGKALAYRSWN